MRIFKTKLFSRWASKEGLEDEALWLAVKEIEQGLVDADLGGCLFKKRIGLSGRGKSAGVRTLLAFKLKNHAFFLYGFAKNEQDNINTKELQALKRLASQLLAYDHDMLTDMIKTGRLEEINHET
jgi:hypothetical protein